MHGDIPIRVPMNDLSIQYRMLKEEMDAALSAVIKRCSFILGPQVTAFESAFAAYCGVDGCAGVSNGTDALKLALLALDIGAGDEVITTSLTFGATVEAIVQVQATPVFVDIEPDRFTLDPAQVEAAITSRTRAIVPVHIYGQMAAMDRLGTVAQAHGLRVVEDAAQAHGARLRGQRAGGYGDLACFSFYPGKNLGAYGDAGAVVGNDESLIERVRQLRNHGQVRGAKFMYREIGYNHRMDGLQGAVLGVKLPHLDGWNQRRREIASEYDAGFGDVPEVSTPAVAGGAEHVYHLYVIRVPDREELAADLASKGIQTAVQYPHPVHMTPAFASFGRGPGSLPVCEQVCTQILSLPMFPDLTRDQVQHVIASVRAHYGCS